MNRYYTMIGSRSTPQEILDLMTKAARKLAQQGWIGRSGGAEGADQCLEDGCAGILSARMEIYLPWEGFNGKTSDNKGYINPSKMANYRFAYQMAEDTHPAWDRCTQGAKTLHTRNVYEVLGKDLKTPSSFVLCYAPPKSEGSDEVKGGTSTAVKLGMKYGVSLINLYYKVNQERLEDFIKEWKY